MGRADDVDPKRCSAVGGGVDQGITGKKCHFTVQGLLRQEQLLAITVDGPAQPTFEKDIDDHGDIGVTYVPNLPGEYILTVKVKDKQIKGSPFKVTILGDSDPKYQKVALIECQGKGLITGKANTQNDFWIDARKAHISDADLSVTIKPPERASSQLNIVDNKDGTFKVQWKPTCSGLYVINVKVEGVHTPSSPYYVRCF